MKRLHLIGSLSVGILLLVSSCKKDIIAPDSLYVPSASDVTNTATLAQLQSGRSIFVNKCGHAMVYIHPTAIPLQTGKVFYQLWRQGLVYLRLMLHWFISMYPEANNSWSSYLRYC